MIGVIQSCLSRVEASSNGIGYSNSSRVSPMFLPFTVMKAKSLAVLTRTVRSLSLDRYP